VNGDRLYDPAKAEGDVEFHGCMSAHCMICGPSGNSTLTDHNEKGILETALHPLTAPRQAALGSNHDSQRQGIYRTNSAGDND
jgi:hypothetical protein